MGEALLLLLPITQFVILLETAKEGPQQKLPALEESADGLEVELNCEHKLVGKDYKICEHLHCKRETTEKQS